MEKRRWHKPNRFGKQAAVKTMLRELFSSLYVARVIERLCVAPGQLWRWVCGGLEDAFLPPLRLLKAISLSSCWLTARASPDPLQGKYRRTPCESIIIGRNKQPKFQRPAVIIAALCLDRVPLIWSLCSWPLICPTC